MKIRTISILGLILVLLSVLYYFDHKDRVERWKVEYEKEFVLPAASTRVVSIAVRNDYGSFRLEKRPAAPGSEESVWWIAEPVEEIADQNAVRSQLIEKLEETRKSPALDRATAGDRPLGLDDKPIEISITVQDKEEPFAFKLGVETPIPGEVYMSDAAAPETIWTTGAGLRKAFNAKLVAFRQKRVLPFGFDRLKKVTVHPGKPNLGSVAIEKDDEGAFRILDTLPTAAAPTTASAATTATARTVSYSADAGKVKFFFSLFEAMTPDGAVTQESLEQSLRTSYQPHIRAELEYERAASDGKTTETATASYLFRVPRTPADDLLFTSETIVARPERNVYRATPDDRNIAFVASDMLIENMRERFSNLRDMRVLRIQEPDIAWLQIERAQLPPIALERAEDGQWRFANEPDKLVNQNSVRIYLLSCLNGLKIASKSPDPPAGGLAEAGLTEPLWRLTLANADRSVRDGFEMGLPTGQDEPYYYCRRISGSGLNVQTSDLFTIGMTSSLRDAFMAPRLEFKPLLQFDAPSVARVHLYFRSDRGSTTMTLRRGADDSAVWSGKLGEREPISIPAKDVENFIGVLGAVEYMLPVPKVTPLVLKQQGLDGAPSVEIRLLDAQNRILAGFARGGPYKKDELHRLVVDYAGNYFYVLKKSALDPIDSSLAPISRRFL